MTKTIITKKVPNSKGISCRGIFFNCITLYQDYPKKIDQEFTREISKKRTSQEELKRTRKLHEPS